MNYKTRTRILQSNPVLLGRHFQYRVEVFFKDIILDGQLGKVINYAIRVEFQFRGSPHIHSLLWVFDAPILSNANIEDYIDFVESVIKCELPRDKSDPLYEHVKTYQKHSHSKSCRKYKNVPCRYNFGKLFCDISQPLNDDLAEDEKVELLKFRKSVLDKVKSYIDRFLDPKHNNLCDPEKENYTPPKTILEILEELEIDPNDYVKCLKMSPDNSFHIHFKRSPDSCFINNYFRDGLLAWEANIDIQPVLDYQSCIAYMCAYVSKSEDESSQAMKQAAKEAYESGKPVSERMKSVAKAYRTHRYAMLSFYKTTHMTVKKIIEYI